MHRIALAATVLAALTGCAGMSRSAVADSHGNASVTGLIALPSSGLQRAEDPCAGVQVNITRPGAPTSVGDVALKQSRGRCLYVVSSVPSNAELQVSVTPGASWKCDTGAAPTLTPATAALKLADYQTDTRDFTVTCAQAAASSAQ